MPDVVHLTKKQLATRYEVTTRTIELWVAAGNFPKPIRLGYRTIRWEESDIVKYEKKNK